MCNISGICLAGQFETGDFPALFVNFRFRLYTPLTTTVEALLYDDDGFHNPLNIIENLGTH